MPALHISLRHFARVVASPPTKRIEVVRDVRRLEASASDPRMNFYRGLFDDMERLLKAGHRPEAIREITTYQHNSVKREKYQSLAERWIDQWRAMKVRFIDLPNNFYWNFDDVAVRVSPMLGMETAEGQFASKLWFPSDKPTGELVAVMLGVMRLAREQNADWEPQWEPSMWDVNRDAFMYPPDPDQFRLVLEDAARSLKAMWGVEAAVYTQPAYAGRT